jgi:methyltransferase family protein
MAMRTEPIGPEVELALAELMPQADASSLVQRELLEARVRDMYRQVVRENEAELHFALGRPLAVRVGYPSGLLDAIPAEALASFAGVGYHLDLAALQSGERVLDLGSGSGTDVFCAAVQVGEAGHVVGVDFTDEQSPKRPACEIATGLGRSTSSRRASTRSRSRTPVSTQSSPTE